MGDPRLERKRERPCREDCARGYEQRVFADTRPGYVLLEVCTERMVHAVMRAIHSLH